MITGFIIGFAIAILATIVLGGAAQKYAIKKGWYASAIWNDKEKTWKVRGNYLHTASKILRSLRGQSDEKVTYL